MVACVGLACVLVTRARRRRIPRYEVVPAVPYCRVRPAHELAAAWRASGFAVVERRRAIELRLDGGRVLIELSAARCFGAAVFGVRTTRPELVHALAEVATRELGPLVCWIAGSVHGFDAPEPPAEQPAEQLSAGAPPATCVLRARAPVGRPTGSAVSADPERIALRELGPRVAQAATVVAPRASAPDAPTIVPRR